MARTLFVVVFVGIVLGSWAANIHRRLETCSPDDNRISEVSAMQHLGVAQGAISGLHPTAIHWRNDQRRLKRSQRCVRVALQEWPAIVSQPLTLKVLHEQARLFPEIQKEASQVDFARGAKDISYVNHSPWLFGLYLLICLVTAGFLIFLFIRWLLQFRKPADGRRD